ncbi:relaxosome protein TraM [Arsenophonus sp. PmNCSU2021_1]|uniref:relaxosome protein TraM n=1 Tax=Arsenophonus sp. PmNCSU2021_1 TaxID=3118989 RepID=UPI002FF07AA9
MKEQNIHRMTLTIPFTILHLIDEIIDEKLKDGENKSTANRTAVALDMLKIGARVLKKKREDGGNQDISLDEKLALIADSVLKTELRVDSMFEFANTKPQDIDQRMMNQYGYDVVKKKFSEVDYKVNYFFRKK